MTGWSLELSKKKETVKLKDSGGVGWGEVGGGGQAVKWGSGRLIFFVDRGKEKRGEMFRERKRTLNYVLFFFVFLPHTRSQINSN